MPLMKPPVASRSHYFNGYNFPRVRRERAAGLYSVSAFSLAQLLVEVPYLVVQATVYVSMVYW